VHGDARNRAEAFMISVATVVALSIAPALANVDLEREARAIETMLIAPCCFSQQVSVHQSAAADEVRRDIRGRLKAGQTRKEILAAYVAQYGTRVLAEPPKAGFSLTLYVMPVMLLVASVGLVVVVLRRYTSVHPADALPAEGSARSVDRQLENRLDDELRDLD
jgi:cytochrome c-type biogenesis protein CcmH/NrfF